jgi:UDP-N-acetylglucosamine 3-dehydrogenase
MTDSEGTVAGRQRLRAAVVGLGIGRHHVEAYAAHPGVELVAVCDENAGRRDDILARFPGVRGYADLTTLLGREAPDVVSVCTPDWLHAEMGIASLRAGAHVICTKPLTTSIEDARRLIAAADEAGRYLVGAHERRFYPPYRAIKRLLDEGQLGRLFYAEIDYFSHKKRQFDRAPWYKSAEHPREAILGTGAHAVDLLRWFAGEVEEVWGAGNHLAYDEFPGDDCQIGVFKLAGGAIGKVTQTYGSVRGQGEPELRVLLHGTRGSIENDRLLSTGGHGGAPPEEIAGRRPWGSVPEVAQAQNTFRAQVEYFVDCFLAGQQPQPDGREAARTVAACLAVVESARTSRPVRPASF